MSASEEKRTGPMSKQPSKASVTLQHTRQTSEGKRTVAPTSRDSRSHAELSQIESIAGHASTMRRHSVWAGKRRMSRKTVEQILVSRVHHFRSVAALRGTRDHAFLEFVWPPVALHAVRGLVLVFTSRDAMVKLLFRVMVVKVKVRGKN